MILNVNEADQQILRLDALRLACQTLGGLTEDAHDPLVAKHGEQIVMLAKAYHNFLTQAPSAE
jgi:hypothetical protein